MSPLTPAPAGYPIKLVRDLTPSILNSTGDPGDLWYGPIPEGTDPMRWLRLKLVEEAGEYLVDGTIDELADLVAVVDALARLHGSSLDEVLDRAVNHDRGGFHAQVMMYGRHPEFDR